MGSAPQPPCLFFAGAGDGAQPLLAPQSLLSQMCDENEDRCSRHQAASCDCLHSLIRMNSACQAV